MRDEKDKKNEDHEKGRWESKIEQRSKGRDGIIIGNRGIITKRKKRND